MVVGWGRKEETHLGVFKVQVSGTPLSVGAQRISWMVVTLTSRRKVGEGLISEKTASTLDNVSLSCLWQPSTYYCTEPSKTAVFADQNWVQYWLFS